MLGVALMLFNIPEVETLQKKEHKYSGNGIIDGDLGQKCAFLHNLMVASTLAVRVVLRPCRNAESRLTMSRTRISSRSRAYYLRSNVLSEYEASAVSRLSSVVYLNKLKRKVCRR